ncbi:MAG: hypothetical protein R3A79_11555 [Nannocystaceae bacterium]
MRRDTPLIPARGRALPTALAALALVFASACGDDAIGSASDSATGSTGATDSDAMTETGSGSDSAGACTPGASQECACDTGAGTQLCASDGSGWGACECAAAVCGDGVVGGAEECDDGANNADEGACTSACKAAVCGDGLVHAGTEACDDGVNDGSYDGCVAGCGALGPRCGDGVTNGPEACDDGDDVQGNGCNVDCRESGSEVWTETYTGRDAGDALAHGVAVDHDGNVIVVGEQFVVGQGANMWIGKFTAAGELLWSQTLVGNGSSADIARAVAVDSSGDYVVVGELAVDGEGGNFWVRKMDPGGEEIWTDVYNGPSDLGDSANAVAIDGEDEIWVVGEEYKLIGLKNAVVRKYAADGTLLWDDVYDHKAGNDRAHGVTVLSDDTAVVVGSVYEPIGLADLWVRRYTATGTVYWEKQWDNAAGNDIIRAVARDADDGVLLVGEVYEPIGLANIWTRKLTDNGIEMWTQVYDSAGSDNDIGRGVAVAPDGTIVVAGQEYTANDFAAALRTLRV